MKRTKSPKNQAVARPAGRRTARNRLGRSRRRQPRRLLPPRSQRRSASQPRPRAISAPAAGGFVATAISSDYVRNCSGTYSGTDRPEGACLLDFLAIFRRRGRPKTRKRKSSGTWRVELEKIGGLVKKSSSGYSASKPDRNADTAAGGAVCATNILLNEALRQESLLQHPLHPETVRQDGYRAEAFRPPRPQASSHPDPVGVHAPTRQTPQHFSPPRPRRADPGFSQRRRAIWPRMASKRASAAARW